MGKIISGKFIMGNGRLFRDEVVGFVMGIVLIGSLAYWLMPKISVVSVIRLLIWIYLPHYLMMRMKRDSSSTQ
jgi:hypothetical protein